MTSPFFSVVLPVFDEAANLPELRRRLVAALEPLGRPFELIFVDDGSQDRSFELLRAFAEQDERVRVIKLSRNFGHHVAISAGLDAACGDAVVLMDADLQDQPEEIPKLYQKLEEGFDVVYGTPHQRQESAFKSLTSRAFVSLLNRIIAPGPPISTSIFRILSRRVVDAVKECKERSRFVVGLISWVGFRQTAVEVQRGARMAGETKYSLSKMVRLAMEAITAFSTVPLRIASLLGLFVCLGAVGALITLIGASVAGSAISSSSFWAAALTLLAGVQLLGLGMIGEYVGRTYREAQGRPLYVVEERLGPGRGGGDARREG